MSSDSNAKKNFVSAVKLFFKTLKDNFIPLTVIVAVYFSVSAAVMFYMAEKAFFPNNLFVLLVSLSFVSLTAPLFSGENVRMRNIVPKFKLALYSFLIVLVAFLFYLLLRIVFDVIGGAILSLFMSVKDNLVIIIIRSLLKTAGLIFVLFCVFDFNRKPSIDQPVINAAEIFKRNKLLLFICVLVFTLFFIFIPPYQEYGAAYFLIYLLFSLAVMPLYYVLKPEDDEIPVIETDTSEIKRPKISF